MKDHYLVMQHKRSQGWVVMCTPSPHKCARGLRDQLRSHFGKGQVIMVKVVE